VYAATKAGVRLVAVATGRNDADDLRRAGAEVVLDDLADLDELTRQVWKHTWQGNRTA
jgi:phosphoglycolate phosphatase-like HAD superfamily hydrolase